jgi:hypothetical protein
VIPVSLENLPADPRAYHGVWAVFFYEQSLRDFSQSQTQALETWIISGGKVVILGSIHYALLQEPSWKQFLPVRVSGLKRALSVPSLEKAYGRKIPLQEFFLQDATPVEGKVLFAEKNIPIVVEWVKGRGKIAYVSLDVGRPPFSTWEGLSLLFKDLLGAPPEREVSWQTNWDEFVFNHVLFSPAFLGRYAPALVFLEWLLGYAAGLGLLTWAWRRGPVKPRMLLSMTVGFIAACSIVGHTYLSSSGKIPDGVLFSSTVLRPLPGGYVESESNVALFSTRPRDYQVQIESGWSNLELLPVRREKAEGAPLTIAERGSFSVLHVPLKEWDYRLLKVRALNRLPLGAEIRGEGDRLSLSIVNDSSKDLLECWVIAPGQQLSLGHIPPRSRQVRELSLAKERATTGGMTTSRNLWGISFSDKLREILLRYSIFPSDYTDRSSSVLVFGWLGGGIRWVRIDDPRVLVIEYTLFRTSIPLESDEEL